MDARNVVPWAGSIGAVVEGLDITGVLTDDDIEFIRAALYEYHVLFFRRQPPFSLDAQTELALRFGSVETEFPSFAARMEGRPQIVSFDGSKPGGRASIWHTDLSVSKTPAMGCILCMKEIPAKGGDTLWADLCAAYEALSAGMRGILDNMTAVHDMFSREYRERPGGFDPSRVGDIDFSRVPRAEHPVVRVLPESQRKTLFINPFFTSHIVGLHANESALLLNYLYSHMERAEFVCRWRWSKGDIAFWDNRCTMHRAVDDYGNSPRLAHRVCIKGDVPAGTRNAAGGVKEVACS